jgi:hypothetical protein
MSLMEERPPPMPTAVSNIHNDAIGHLKFVKQQQWSVANYAILLIAGAYATSRLPHEELRLPLYCGVLFTTAVGIFLLWFMQGAIWRARRRLAAIYGRYLTEEERKLFKASATPKPQLQDWPILFALTAAIFTVGLVVSYLIARS